MQKQVFALCVFGGLSACFFSVSEDGGVDSGVRCVETQGHTVCAAVQTEVRCGLTVCAAGSECCQSTGACVAPGAAQCPAGSTKAPESRACGRQSDCAASEFCMSDDTARCVAQGHCQSISNCGFCGGPGTPQCQVCGCDGVTYGAIQEACVAGVRSVQGACGVPVNDAGVTSIRCGAASQCPAGSLCCPITARCYPQDEAWRCEEQPDGSVLDCVETAECNTGAGGAGGSDRLCAGDGCTGPGVCAARGSTSTCGGDVNPVCGCDGQNYVNACWAQAAGVRVVQAGNCP